MLSTAEILHAIPVDELTGSKYVIGVIHVEKLKNAAWFPGKAGV